VALRAALTTTAKVKSYSVFKMIYALWLFVIFTYTYINISAKAIKICSLFITYPVRLLDVLHI